ncbi:2-hydroxychromene-2-carboxylate isomerase [Lutimaribacter marinistellae]|uniref:2-hydroxychromene-2-carboxylate isomerase n=1 Tax=Lutimaribacter marinistellae TaxID=1820329 RepID=A0ABV7TMN1_9RHOB
MSKTLDFYYDFGSPNAYLAHQALPPLARRLGVSIAYKPILLGGVFKATGNRSPMEAFGGIRHKLAYYQRETQRFARRHEIKFYMNPHFPINTLSLMRGAMHAQGKPWEGDYINAVFDAIWVHGQKMDDPSVITDVLRERNLPAREVMEAVQSAEVKQALLKATEAAVERGVFGAPMIFLGDEPYFGKEAIYELEVELSDA